ncbi:E3 SUMO-protein ligase ZBED1-like [Lasioglossum baleicum]|uniref:E3 SUMO-protein ligase ZBED1-like n=1 Tax=Lasioglossum baleicum TaxID=434251 RepID=UPI003FCDDD65
MNSARHLSTQRIATFVKNHVRKRIYGCAIILKPTNHDAQDSLPSTNSGSDSIETMESDMTIIMEENRENSENNERADPETRRPQQQKRRCRRGIESNQSSAANHRICDRTRTEDIHEALAKLIVLNQLPLSFCSSVGFQNFMHVVEPNYKTCKEEAIKRRLVALKTTIEEKMTQNLRATASVACTTDCWSSLTQDTYITLTVQFIDKQWNIQSYTLTTHEMEERHTAENIANELKRTLDDWEITNKVVSIVTDNASNIKNAISLMSEEIENVACAAHTLQLAIKKALTEDNVEQIIRRCSKIVGHFKHSNVAKKALEIKQRQLGITKTTLLQCCSTRWNSTFFMLERIRENRCSITNVIADRAITNLSTARNLEVTECQWENIDSLLNVLKPLQIITTLFCGEKNASVSMVRPLLNKLIENHLNILETDNHVIRVFKETVLSEIKNRFQLNFNEESTTTITQISCFLDPRYKDLEHESPRTRIKIRNKIKNILDSFPNETTNRNVDNNLQQTALQFLYNDEIFDMSNINSEYEKYIVEPQIRFDLCIPKDWYASLFYHLFYFVRYFR